MGCHVGCDGVVGSVKLFSKRPAGELSASDVVGCSPPSEVRKRTSTDVAGFK